MQERKVKGSLVAKAISMVMLPVFILLIIVTIGIAAFTIEYPEVKNNPSFYTTDHFASIYESQIYEAAKYTMQVKENIGIESNQYLYVETPEANIYYNENYSQKEQGFEYLILDEANKRAFTNMPRTMQTDTVAEIKSQILAKSQRWSSEASKIDTNIAKLSEEQLKYDSFYRTIQRSYLGEQSIYTAYNEAALSESSISSGELAFRMISKTYMLAYILLPISIIMSIILTIYLGVSCGHRKEDDEIHLSGIDRIPLEVFGGIYSILLVIETGLIALSLEAYRISVPLCIGFVVLTSYILCFNLVYVLGSTLKRIKTKTFFKNSFTYRIFYWFCRKVKSIYENIVYNPNTTLKVLLTFGGFAIISWMLIAMAGNSFFGFILLIAFWVVSFEIILKVIKQCFTIKNAIQDIYNGKVDIHLEEDNLKGVLKELAKYVNDIAGGFSNAVEESLKSERLKTELITNVSHDIKTPLTSIINYIDLLKKEEIEDEKVKEYLDVLDRKSQRLKKLTEDLVEASKASSGNLKLNKEEIRITELIKQVTGEFEDKFSEKRLEVISDLPKEESLIVADNRYLYRVIENLYSNIAKYALEGSRVYVDVSSKNNMVHLTIKNISKQELNISAEELKQRFVRGDSARNTEGSGLGLSIAESLTKLQNGTFEIYLDGDLFKIELVFPEKKAEEKD